MSLRQKLTAAVVVLTGLVAWSCVDWPTIRMPAIVLGIAFFLSPIAIWVYIKEKGLGFALRLAVEALLLGGWSVGMLWVISTLAELGRRAAVVAG